MKKILLGLLGLLLISLFSYICFIMKSDSIKENIISSVNNTLNKNNYDWANASLVGNGIESTNIVKLTGIAPSVDDKMNAQMLVTKVNGVGGVENFLEVKQSPSEERSSEENANKLAESQKLVSKNDEKNITTGEEHKIKESQKLADNKNSEKTDSKNDEIYHIYLVKNAKNKIFLEGDIPNKELHEKLVNQASTLFGKENIVDNLKVVKNAPKDWNYMSEFGLEKLAEVDFGDMNITGNSYVFKAHLKSHDKKIEFLNGIKEVMSDPKNHYGRYRGDYIVTAPVIKKEENKIETANTAPVSKETKKEVKEPKPEKIAQKSNAIECQEFLNRTISSKKIHFKFNSYKIDSDSYALLNDIADAISSCKDLDSKVVEIGGHTDSKGRASYNKWLSQKRAQSVMKYLVKTGISQNRLKAVGFGEDYPIADNKTEEGRAMNRRIEFKIKGE